MLIFANQQNVEMEMLAVLQAFWLQVGVKPKK